MDCSRQKFLEFQAVLVLDIDLVDLLPFGPVNGKGGHHLPPPEVFGEAVHLPGPGIGLLLHPLYPFGIEIPGPKLFSDGGLDILYKGLVRIGLVGEDYVGIGAFHPLHGQGQPTQLGKDPVGIQALENIGGPGVHGDVHPLQILLVGRFQGLSPDVPAIGKGDVIDEDIGDLFVILQVPEAGIRSSMVLP